MKNLDTFHVDRLASPLTLRVENLQLSSDHPGVHRGTTSEVSTLAQLQKPYHVSSVGLKSTNPRY